MKKTRLMYLVRTAAVLLGLMYGPGLLFPPEALARFSGCSPRNYYGCITWHAAYENKACIGGGEPGGGEVHCVTCDWEPESICTWCGGDLGDYFNPTTFPECDSIPE